ncbi:hypothetical protein OROGR_002244 [Orobanche gracilis]
MKHVAGTRVKKFLLNTSYHDKYESQVIRLIHYAVNYNVQELDLSFWADGWPDVEIVLLDVTSLVEANLDYTVDDIGNLSPTEEEEMMYGLLRDLRPVKELKLGKICSEAYVWRLYKEDRSMELIDATLIESLYVSKALWSAQVGLLCVQHSSIDRSNISLLVLMLAGEVLGGVRRVNHYSVRAEVIENVVAKFPFRMENGKRKEIFRVSGTGTCGLNIAASSIPPSSITVSRASTISKDDYKSAGLSSKLGNGAKVYCFLEEYTLMDAKGCCTQRLRLSEVDITWNFDRMKNSSATRPGNDTKYYRKLGRNDNLDQKCI